MYSVCPFYLVHVCISDQKVKKFQLVESRGAHMVRHYSFRSNVNGMHRNLQGLTAEDKLIYNHQSL